MKIQKVVLIAMLLLGSVATVAAQNALPNPNDDNCWSSLTALRACQQQAYDQAQQHAQQCTSYPEYQCFDYYQPQQKAVESQRKSDSTADHNTSSSSRINSGATAALTSTAR